MKSWDDLTKNEREKFMAYALTRGVLDMKAMMLLCVGVLIAISSVFILVFTIVGAVALYLLGAIILILVIQRMVSNQKYLKIVFDFESAETGLFEITNQDYMNMKKVWMVKRDAKK